MPKKGEVNLSKKRELSMGKSSVHIAPGAGGYFSHNSRESYSHSQVFFDEKNEISCTQKEAFETFRNLIAERSQRYKERTGQKLQKKTVTHLSAVVNLEKHHTLSDLKPILDHIEQKLDTKIVQVSIHRDEGKLVNRETGEIRTSGEHFFANPADQKLYWDKKYTKAVDMSEWKIEKNYHAHLEFVGLDSNGKSIKRGLTTTFFRKLQDVAADSLGMERGERSVPTYTSEQMREIKKGIGKKKDYTNDKEYGKAFTEKAKELGYWKPQPKRSKRKDTHEYKSLKAKENEVRAEELAKQKHLKAEIAELRAKLKERGAERAEYAKLEELNRELKREIREQEITINSLQKQVEELGKELFEKIALGGELKQEIRNLESQNRHLEERVQFASQKTDIIKEAIAEDAKDEYMELRIENMALKDDLRRAEVALEQKDAQIAKLERFTDRLVGVVSKLFQKIGERMPKKIDDIESFLGIGKPKSKPQTPKLDVLQVLELYQSTGEIAEAVRTMMKADLTPADLPESLQKLKKELQTDNLFETRVKIENMEKARKMKRAEKQKPKDRGLER